MTETELREHAATHGSTESCAKIFDDFGPIRKAIMLAIPPSLFGRLAAVSIIASSCFLSLNSMPWRGGKVGC